MATEVGIPTQEGTFPFKYEILRDFAPTWENTSYTEGTQN